MVMNNGHAATTATSEISEEQILNTLDAGFRTVGGIKKKLGVPAYKDITEDIDFLLETKKIVKISNGTLTAYFRADEKPERIWLAGDGRVNASFAGDEEEEAPVVPTARSSKGKKVEFTPDDLERAAAEYSSQSKIAKALGCSESLMWLRLKKKEFRDAYDRGLAKRGKAPKVKAKTKKPTTRKPVVEIVEAMPTVEAIAASVVLPKAQTKPVHSRYTTFSRGGQLLLAYEGSLFDLRRNEFELITAITDLLDQFEGAE